MIHGTEVYAGGQKKKDENTLGKKNQSPESPTDLSDDSAFFGIYGTTAWTHVATVTAHNVLAFAHATRRFSVVECFRHILNQIDTPCCRRRREKKNNIIVSRSRNPDLSNAINVSENYTFQTWNAQHFVCAHRSHCIFFLPRKQKKGESKRSTRNDFVFVYFMRLWKIDAVLRFIRSSRFPVLARATAKWRICVLFFVWVLAARCVLCCVGYAIRVCVYIISIWIIIIHHNNLMVWNCVTMGLHY